MQSWRAVALERAWLVSALSSFAPAALLTLVHVLALVAAAHEARVRMAFDAAAAGVLITGAALADVA
jgi:hypothetical protein